MEIVHGSQQQFIDPKATHRPGGISFKWLSRGTPDTPDNYVFWLARQQGFYSPRHRHNFDQFRYAVKGDFSLSPHITLKQGDLAYHPEGCFYGPQNDGTDEQILLVLQFGGASGEGFVDLERIKAANTELVDSGKGVFEEGKFYRRNGDEIDKGRPIDGFEAAWSHVMGRKLVYPEGRYSEPVVMKPEAFKGKKSGHGVVSKTLGMFSEREVVARMHDFEDGGKLEIVGTDGVQLLYVTRGNGKVGNETIETESTIKLESGQQCAVIGAKDLQFLHFIMPPVTV